MMKDPIAILLKLQ